jgi:hypothetical protein
MRLKGVEQLYEQTRPPAGPFWRELSDDQRKQFAKIVRAAESKGVDRAIEEAQDALHLTPFVNNGLSLDQAGIALAVSRDQVEKVERELDAELRAEERET